MSPDEQCYFLVNGRECTEQREDPYPFCPQHRTFFAGLDNPTLIEQTARVMIQTMYVTKEKKLTARADRNLMDVFINGLHELYGRRYSEEEALDAISAVAQEKGMYDDLFKQMNRDPKWKQFEKIIAGIHMLQTQGAEVKYNDSIVGKKTGRPRQVDVSIRFKEGFYDYLTIVECKDLEGRVPVKEVEAFSKKMEDLGARHGVMVSTHGFQKSAIGTARFDNIELFTLAEIKSDWTKKIKADVLILPYPTEIEFDYPYFEASQIPGGELEINFNDVLFYKNQHTPPLPLTTLLKNIAIWAVKNELALPCRVKAPFNPPALYQFPGTTFYTPIYAMYVKLEPHRFALGYEIDVPPKLEKYVYTGVTTEQVYEFRASDLPKVE